MGAPAMLQNIPIKRHGVRQKQTSMETISKATGETAIQNFVAIIWIAEKNMDAHPEALELKQVRIIKLQSISFIVHNPYWFSASVGRQNKCTTSGGPKSGYNCIFPFSNNGKVYGGCTCDLNSPDEKPWCSTKTDSDGVHIKGNWGYCNPTYCGDLDGRQIKIHIIWHKN